MINPKEIKNHVLKSLDKRIADVDKGLAGMAEYLNAKNSPAWIENTLVIHGDAAREILCSFEEANRMNKRAYEVARKAVAEMSDKDVMLAIFPALYHVGEPNA